MPTRKYLKAVVEIIMEEGVDRITRTHGSIEAYLRTVWSMMQPESIADVVQMLQK